MDETKDLTPEAEQPEPAQEAAQEAPAVDILKDPAVVAYIQAQIQEGIQKALQGKTPKANTTDPTAAERAAFRKMGYKERLQLYNSNPHTYNNLAKGSN